MNFFFPASACMTDLAGKVNPVLGVLLGCRILTSPAYHQNDHLLGPFNEKVSNPGFWVAMYAHGYETVEAAHLVNVKPIILLFVHAQTPALKYTYAAASMRTAHLYEVEPPQAPN
jgi:hypothetical protein